MRHADVIEADHICRVQLDRDRTIRGKASAHNARRALARVISGTSYATIVAEIKSCIRRIIGRVHVHEDRPQRTVGVVYVHVNLPRRVRCQRSTQVLHLHRDGQSVSVSPELSKINGGKIELLILARLISELIVPRIT